MTTYAKAVGFAGAIGSVLYAIAEPGWFDRNIYHLPFMPRNTYIGINRERISYSNTRIDFRNEQYVYHRKVEFYWKTRELVCESQGRYENPRNFRMDLSARDHIKTHEDKMKKL